MKYLGHTTKEAEELIKKHGENTLYESKEYPLLKSIVSSFKEPMMVILLVACGTYYFIGKFTDFLILTISACIIFSINIFQNLKAENAIQKLKKLTQKFAEVYRDGEKVRILASKIVPGDIIILNEGERIPADVVILESSNLTIDESILTGESLPVQKTSNTNTKTKKLELESLAYSGTIITSGWLVGSVYETGKETKIGKMGLSLSNLVDEEPLVKKEINSIVSKLAILGIFTCSFVFGYGYFSTFQDISRQIDILSTIGKVDGYHKVRDYHAILLRKFILELFITYIKRLPSVKELEYHTDSNFYSKSSIIEHIFKNCNEAILNRDIIFVFDDEIEKNDLVFYDIPLEEVSSKYKVYKITYLQELFSKIMCN